MSDSFDPVSDIYYTSYLIKGLEERKVQGFQTSKVLRTYDFGKQRTTHIIKILKKFETDFPQRKSGCKMNVFSQNLTRSFFHIYILFKEFQEA